MIADRPLPRPYNPFLSKSDIGICCAVLQDEPAPTFIDGGDWEFGTVLARTTALPRDFNRRAAQTAMKINGYYIFAMLRS